MGRSGWDCGGKTITWMRVNLSLFAREGHRLLGAAEVSPASADCLA